MRPPLGHGRHKQCLKCVDHEHNSSTNVQTSSGSFLFSPRAPPLSDGPICRICHEGGIGEGLLSPCYCTGTLGAVHKSCLEKWLSSSNTSYCELCHTEFSVERRPRPLTEVTEAAPVVPLRWSGGTLSRRRSVALERLNRRSRLKSFGFLQRSGATVEAVRLSLRCSHVRSTSYSLTHHIYTPPSSFLIPQWLQDPGPLNEKRTLFCDMVCFLFITPLAAISGWLCLRGAQDHLQLGSWLQAVGLITLTIALFTIYVLWTLVNVTSCGSPLRRAPT